MPKLFCILTVLAVCAPAQTVEGSVIDSARGDGVAGVTVEILEAGKAVYSATTDAQGSFRIEGVKDGTYTARYHAPYYLPEPWPPSEPAAFQPFQVTAAGNPVRLEARMIPEGRMTGRVIDGRDEPVPNARLYLTSSTVVLVMSTDARGNFDQHLLPGAYTLSAAPWPDRKPPDPERGSDGVLSWARTYYPGTAVPEGATKIVLRPGAEVAGIEIKLLAVPAHPVRGVLLDPYGRPVPKVAIALGDEAVTPFLLAESKPDGTFEFPAVVDGEWRLSAEVESGGVKLRLAHWIEMTGHELDGVVLRLNAPFMVRGRVVIDTPKGWVAPKPPSVSLLPVRRGRLSVWSLLEPAQLARSDADGDFSLSPVYPGIYQLDATESPAAYYLDAVRLGEAELHAPELELSSGAIPITLVYKTNGGMVRGTVDNCASGGVVLVPQDPAMRWPGLIHRVRCDSNDHYEITSVRPGEYYALAVHTDVSSRRRLPTLDDGRLDQASKVTVRAGETCSADLRAIAQPLY